MDKANNHPYKDLTVYFGTKHSKEEAIAPLLLELGIFCEAVLVDTDQFGTFSGEVNRRGTIRDTLRKKIEATIKAKPNARLLLASEGSFGPHPLMPFMQTDHEALLFFDRELNLEIYVEEISTETNYTELEFAPRDDLHAFLKKIDFPAHAVVVKPKGGTEICKGLNTFHKVGQAMLDCFTLSPDGKVILGTDMRAHFNPLRMKVIKRTGVKLIEQLKSKCTSCGTLGFGPIYSIQGLPCEACENPTNMTKEIEFGCMICNYRESKPRPDGLETAPQSKCDYCNP